jgi:chemotaxis response regulator CheB
VAIGGSAGCPEAYKEFFHALTVDTGLVFVLIQHLDSSYHSTLAKIFRKQPGLRLITLRNGST